jgi:hypothetical protein
MKIMLDEQFSLNYHTKASALGYHLWTTQMFEESRGLFWITNLQIVIRLRDLETPMGIVPVPKFSEDQEDYSNVVWTVGSYVAVPKTVTDQQRVGVILEAMAAKSMQLLRPAYYDIALNGKYLRDEESIGMLDIIIKERVYDLGLAYGFGGITDIIQGLGKKGGAAHAGADGVHTGLQVPGASGVAGRRSGGQLGQLFLLQQGCEDSRPETAPVGIQSICEFVAPGKIEIKRQVPRSGQILDQARHGSFQTRCLGRFSSNLCHPSYDCEE